jgi:hypothetical protein
VTGKIDYDVDNDGDGVTDSVWVDLGYPARRDSRGQLYKPMFAFMVIGLNGRIPLNTAGNLAGTGATHASHVGNSVSEIDPTYALQNSFDGSPADMNLAFTAPVLPYNAAVDADNSQVDSGGIDVRLTQLRNLLAGTRPQPVPLPSVPAQYPFNSDPTGSTNGDDNFVLTNAGFSQPRPYFMPNGVGEVLGIDIPSTSHPDALGNPQVVRFSQPVPGRWGEAQAVPGLPFLNTGGTAWINALDIPVAGAPTVYRNPVRAGYSRDIGDTFSGSPRDAADDNFNSFDPYPAYDPVTGVQRLGEMDDRELYDPAGALLLPIDRMRRWLAPPDINGTGSIRQWNTATVGLGPNLGPDAWGRVEYSSYFRPPGAPGVINVNYNPIVAATPPNTNPTPVVAGTTLGATYYPSTANTNFYTVGPNPDNLTGGVAGAYQYLPDFTNNPLHGFESFKLPNRMAGYGTVVGRSRPYDPQDFGGMPADLNATLAGNYIPTAYPTYDFSVNSNPHVLSDGLNEADEMNLYSPDPNSDAPFGPGDLDWLYRQHDVDGAKLSSRLSQLAPISFNNGPDGTRRRRLFSLDSWELNNFVWTTDNPGNTFPNNQRFGPAQNASFSTLGLPMQASLAHRDKKINLNYPLPVSNDPDEPVRQKWISETYQFLKRVLPPRAVDTPEELAQLSQFVINIIDFRDPDCTMTRFRNPDVVLVLGSVVTSAGANVYAPPKLYFSNAAIPPPVPPAPAPIVLNPAGLDQFGMEYNPIAINETMAYSFLRKVVTGTTATATATPRFFVELVNTLTAAVVPPGSTTNASLIDLSTSNFDLVITKDDPASRPDPFLGQLLPINNTSGAPTVFGPIPLQPTSFTTAADMRMTPLSPAGYPALPPPPPPPTNYFNVIANTLPDLTAESNPGVAMVTQTLATQFDPTDTTTNPTGTPPTPAPGALTLDPTTPALVNGVSVGVANKYPVKPWMPILGSGGTAYYWICLRRPASPFLPPNPDPTGATGPYNPMIVVDSMRFPYVEGGGTGTTAGGVDTVVEGNNALYSVQRAQPYRGGHAVRLATDATTTAAVLNTAYGYSEQTAAPVTQTTNNGLYGTTPITGPTPTATGGRPGIYHTLGAVNDQAEPWDWFVFNDRDFTSVAELVLVPGSPPGLFTKQFVELPPMVPSLTPYAAGAYTFFPVVGGTGTFTFPPPNPPTVAVPIAGGPPTVPNAYAYAAPAAAAPIQPHTYPYLVDKFFYSGASLPAPGATPTTYAATDTAAASVNTAASDGWYRMFEFFEVPSQMIGAIGPVAQGANFDWARNDIKPGLMNLNLIVDEEAFCSVFGQQTYTATAGVDPYNQTLLNFAQLGPYEANIIPKVVTASTDTGAFASYPVQSSGVMTADWLNPLGPGPALGLGNNGLKAAFAQFLTLRHGGSGLLFNFTGDRPFRSLSYPDINFTVMRPATLPPVAPMVPSPFMTYGSGTYGADAGFRNPYLYQGGFASSVVPTPAGYTPGTPFTALPAPNPNVAMPPPVPARRLFQVPDAYGTTTVYPPITPATPPQSNASDSGDPFINVAQQTGALAPITVPTPAGPPATYYLNNGYPTLTWSGNAPAAPAAPPTVPPTGAPVTNLYLGSRTAGAVVDYRQHPYWRSEMLQKVMNLTTVRTHQFAVWITVGFFEVTRVGDLTMLASPTPQYAFDTIGPEVGAVTGNNVRYRGFFLVDRTKLIGFNASNTGSFRAAVVYRKVIE